MSGTVSRPFASSIRDMSNYFGTGSQPRFPPGSHSRFTQGMLTGGPYGSHQYYYPYSSNQYYDPYGQQLGQNLQYPPVYRVIQPVTVPQRNPEKKKQSQAVSISKENSYKISLKIISFNVCDEGNLFYMVKGKENWETFKGENPKFIPERRQVLKNVILSAINEHKPDIICLQESFLELKKLLDDAISSLDKDKYELAFRDNILNYRYLGEYKYRLDSLIFGGWVYNFDEVF